MAATASGQKLPVVIIFKERRVKSKLKLPANVHVRGSTNGWMTVPEYHHCVLKKKG